MLMLDFGHVNMNKLFDINYFCFLNAETGLGEAARNHINALKSVGVLVESFDVANLDMGFRECYKENAINIFHLNPDDLYDFLLRYGTDIFSGTYNIAFWAWETEVFPDHYQKYFEYFDEIWTPSSYCQEAISKKSPIPVLKMPHAIPVITGDEELGGLRHSLMGDRGNSTFIFSFFFDYNSQMARKNVLGLIESFYKAFGKNNSKATLLLKTSPSKRHAYDRDLLSQKVAGDKGIILLEEILERSALQNLLRITDCYISLHHAEGFGLTMAEAMALGKPVIATGYSGNIDFMNLNNAILVNYKLTTLTEQVGPFVVGSHWADPDLDHAADLMRRMVDKYESFDSIAMLAQEQIRTSHSLIAIGGLMSQRLHLIAQFTSHKINIRINEEINRLNLENELLNAKVNKLKEIKFVKLKLKIKNLQNRLLGKNKKYLWE
jgi:glycosyltransferase involved in cell wall biosynthesis